MMVEQECANLQRIRDDMAKEGREEISYQRWAEAAGVDEAVLRSRLQEGYCCRERLLVTTEWLVKYIARSYTGMGTAFDDLLQVTKHCIDRYISCIHIIRALSLYD
jgi:RNA polymerase sigma factor